MAARNEGDRRAPALAGECEHLWLLHTEAEYISFLVSLESEERSLRHLLSCPTCRAALSRIFTGGREPADELERLFSLELPARLGGGSGCPEASDYKDAGAFIDARINWRLGMLRKLRTDAELELGHLSERIRKEG